MDIRSLIQGTLDVAKKDALEKKASQPTPVRQAIPQAQPTGNSVVQQMLAEKGAVQAPKAPQKNFLQQVADPLADLLATGYRSAQGLGRGAQAIGQNILGDKAGSQETMRKINEDIYKPVNIPLLGQGDVRQIGTVTEGGAIAPSKETLKTLGTGLELASFAAPVKGGKALTSTIGNTVLRKTANPLLAKTAGTVGKYAIPGALAGGLSSGGSKLAETGDVGEAVKSGTTGALVGGAIGTAIPKIAGAVSKKTAPVSKVAAKQKLISSYESVLGVPKGIAKQEAKRAAGKFIGKDHKRALETIAESGFVPKMKNVDGVQKLDLIDGIEQFNVERSNVGSQMQAALQSRTSRDIDYNILANRAKIKIRNLPNKTELQKNKMIDEVDNLIQAQKVANGWKEGNKVAMSKSAKIGGREANQFKTGLHDMAYKNGVLKQEADHLNILAEEFNNAIDQRYGNFADIKALRKRYSDIKNAQDYLIERNGNVVAGGRIPKLASRGLGAAIGMAVPLPVSGFKEYFGSEIGGKLHDVMTDPARLTQNAIAKYQAATNKKVPSNVVKWLEKISDFIPDINPGAAMGAFTGSGGQSMAQPEQSMEQPAQEMPTNDIVRQMLEEKKAAR